MRNLEKIVQMNLFTKQKRVTEAEDKQLPSKREKREKLKDWD